MKPLVSSGLILITAIASCLIVSEPTVAQSCNYYVGKAVEGQTINIDTCSISRANYRSVNFVYYLGSDRVESQANCQDLVWTTFPERIVHSPQSAATRKMLDYVCNFDTQSSITGTAFVFDPPSNVRVSPNGNILCVVRSPQTIDLYGRSGEWYYTDACGSMGMIHSSQLRF
ncbi:MAG TPA: hypothetical protein DCZ88_11680 [Pseudanabaena sp.]|nr:hypothetical protein [Pseudanabaena sp.]